MDKLVYICIYNPETIVIEGKEQYIIGSELDQRWMMYQTECLARGAPWTPYRGDVPFEFPKKEETTI